MAERKPDAKMLYGPPMSVVEILCRARLAQLNYPGWVIPDADGEPDGR